MDVIVVAIGEDDGNGVVELVEILVVSDLMKYYLKNFVNLLYYYFLMRNSELVVVWPAEPWYEQQLNAYPWW